jgi:hypothetical protein
MQRRARVGGHGRRYPAPRTVREALAHLRRGWSFVEVHRAMRAEAHRAAMEAHDRWLESLDADGG